MTSNSRKESGGIKSPRIVSSEESQEYDSSKIGTSFEGEQNRVRNVIPEPSPASKEKTEEDDATIIEHVSDVIGSGGGTLNCPESGVMLIIPEGAIKEGVRILS